VIIAQFTDNTDSMCGYCTIGLARTLKSGVGRGSVAPDEE